MKCPKCGFNSFEFYDKCKKCSNDLVGYKQTYSISSLVLPREAKEQLAAEFRSNESSADEMHVAAEAHDDIFSFDLPEESSPASHQSADDPFSFDDPSPSPRQEISAQSEDDVFADLLESTSQADESPFAAPAAAAAKTAAPAASGPGEFDLGSFSWDETSTAPAAPGTTGTADDADDFDSLFGDTKENSTK